jgi:hypothetical protein
VQKSAGKVLASIFWDKYSILLIYCLPNGQTINAEYYSSLLVRLKDILKENAAGRSPRGSCSSMTMPRLTRIWSLRATHLFPGLQNKLKGSHFSSDTEAIADAETWLDLLNSY